MPERYDNIIYKLFLRSKTIKAILSSTTRIGLIIYIEDPKEASSINRAYIENTKAKKTTVINIITTNYSIRSNVISIINLNASQINIQ